MATTALLMKRCSCKFVLGLLVLTTTTSSLGIQVVERQRHQPVIGMLSIDRYGKTSNVGSSSSLDRLSADSDSRMLPVSTRLHHSASVTERSLPADKKQFPVKRRWNSGNLRVWGKRYSSALPAASSVSHGQTGDRWVEEVPFWLLQSRTNKYPLTGSTKYRRSRATHV